MSRFLLLVGAALAALMVVSSASAGKPPRSASPLDSVALAAGNPALGQSLSFSYVLVERVKSPRIQVVCSQNGTVVYAEAAPAGQSFLLGGASSMWLNDPVRASQPADCVATLYSWDFTPVQTFVPYATTSFTAAGK